jgi:glycosyltransferase involved in cell wall biosynthesis
MEKISVIIITLNEEKNLGKCLESIKSFDEIVVADSGSTDRTLDMARQYTDKIFHRNFDNFSSQRNFAISKCKNNWVLSLDADEAVSPGLREKLEKFTPDTEAGYRIKRNTFLFGRLMNFGGHDKDVPLRFFDKRTAEFVQPIHEFVKVDGKIGFMEEPIMHYSSRSIDEYMKKLLLYTQIEARFMREKGIEFAFLKAFFYPVIKFFQRYILQSGFKDGMEGFIFYCLSGFYDFVKWIRLWELTKKEHA